MSTNTFDPEDFVTYGGRAIHRAIIHQKIATLGWTPEQTAMLTDEQVKQVMEGRLGPNQIQLMMTKPGSSVILDQDDNMDDDSAAIMGAPEPVPQSGVVMESVAPRTTQAPVPPQANGRRLTGVKPPASVAQADQSQAPSAPTIGRQPAPPPAPVVPPPPPPRAVLPAPATDWRQIMAILDAAISLATLTEAPQTKAQAQALVTANNLWGSMREYNRAVYDQIVPDTIPEEQDLCLGGLILKVEVANGGIHILTNKGTLTLTGQNLNLTPQEQ